MRLTSGHLTYCSNIHPGESWEELEGHLRRHVPELVTRLAPADGFGLGLRLSARAAWELERPETFERCSDMLRELGAYVFTVNGFPYGQFHGARVKEDVYLPDWRSAERLDYTTRLARVLARLAQRHPEMPRTLSISTVPGCFRALGDADARTAIAARLIEQAQLLHQLAEETGVTVVLALEPEPACLLETTAECVRFLEEDVFRGNAGLPEAVSRRHLGLCLDTCHAAVQFEDPEETLALIRSSEITLAKIQVTAGLSVPKAGPEERARLAEFADGVYLHQGSVDLGDEVVRFVDLPEALGRAELWDRPWRVHFHVPVFQRELPPFESTQPYVRAILAAHRARPLTEHLEVETYTFDVLPERFKPSSVTEAIARELEWTLRELDASNDDAQRAARRDDAPEAERREP